MTTPYREIYRPQFHFTAQKNWLNDPNGLLFHEGEYHLFFQHNPEGVEWGNMTWGHAVSPDMFRWKQLPHAIYPDESGTIFSGSGVVDWENTTGFKAGGEVPLVCIYTSAGKPFTQSVAYSADNGRTWTKYGGNPVLGHIVAENRDPKVIWHAPTERWVMALYLSGNDYALFASPNLKEWTRLSDLRLPDASECPDMFALSVDNDPDRMKWVFWGGNGNHFIGTFDGREFRPESEVLRTDFGANFYAAQTWSDVPVGRRLQIGWMNGGKYPNMPFNQQMSIPCELTLRTTLDGIRLFREPVAELATLRGREYARADVPLPAAGNPLADLSGDLFEIRAEFELRGATSVGFHLRGEAVEYNVSERRLSCLGRSATLLPDENRIRLRILLDRASIEVFGNDGRVSLTSCFLPDPANLGLDGFASGGDAALTFLKVNELRSVWE